MDILTLLIVILLVAWLLGVGSLGVMAGGGTIHLLLVIIVVIVLVRVLQGRSVL